MHRYAGTSRTGLPIRLAHVAERCWRGCCSDKDGAASYVQDDPADPRGVIRGQEQGGMSHVIGRTKTLDRMGVPQLFLDGPGDLLLIAFGQDRLGGQTVDPDAVGPRLGGQFLSEHFDTGFGGGVGQWGLGTWAPGGG